MELKEGMYIRTKDKNNNQFIRKIIDMPKDTRYGSIVVDKDIHYVKWVSMKNILKASYNIIDLIEYMDLLEIENPIKVYGSNKEVSLFNPVRCDGFTEFEDGTRCIILNLDYLVDVKDLKVKSVATKEQFENMSYKVGD